MNALRRNIVITLAALLPLTFAAAPAAGAEQVSSRLTEDAGAQTPGAQAFADAVESNLYSLIKTAYENNPGIAAARSEWRAAVERIPQAQSLPDPMLSFTYFPSPIETRLGANRGQFMLSQMFPARGKRRLMGDKAASMADVAELKYEIAVRDVITDLRISYAELQYLQTAIRLTGENKTLVENLLAAAERDYAAGSIPQQDYLRAQSQLAQVSYDLLLLEELRETETTKINSLLNRPPTVEFAVPDPERTTLPDLDLDALYVTAMENRQEILLAGALENVGEIGVGLAKKTSSPNFTVGAVYNLIGEAINPTMTDSGRDAWGINFGATLPIWRTKNRATVNEARFALNSASATKRDRINMTDSMVKNLFFKIRTSGRLVELYENTLLPQARKSLEISETLYASGQSSFSEMLETQAVWLNFELALARARTDLAQNIAKMEQALGASLPVKTAKGGE